MSDTDALQARIDSLEIRVAYQDRIIEDLNGAVTEQWKQIDAVTRRIAHLVDRVEAAETRAATGAPEPPPPHY